MFYIYIYIYTYIDISNIEGPHMYIYLCHSPCLLKLMNENEWIFKLKNNCKAAIKQTNFFHVEMSDWKNSVWTLVCNSTPKPCSGKDILNYEEACHGFRFPWDNVYITGE